MGEALLFEASARSDGWVDLGPLAIQPRKLLEARGPVRVAIRPEAWRVMEGDGGADADGASTLPGRVVKQAYLGHAQELTVETALGALFIVDPQVSRLWRSGEAVALTLDGRSVSVLAD